jgi:hypothetical protein
MPMYMILDRLAPDEDARETVLLLTHLVRKYYDAIAVKCAEFLRDAIKIKRKNRPQMLRACFKD